MEDEHPIVRKKYHGPRKGKVLLQLRGENLR
jgi:hypothetical protein